MPFTPLMIALGAVPGALCRYYITEWSKQKLGNRFPHGTFWINITGCWVMGLLIATIAHLPNFPVEGGLLLATGFLGSYTTFSTYGIDTLNLWRSGDRGSTLFYSVGSMVFGVLAVQLGMAIVQTVIK